MPIPALALALLPAAYQGIQGVRQHRLAKRLKESTFVPQELLMNRDLALQQAYSRRAPGQGFAEEQARRNQATQISAGMRSFGGDANKNAAIASAATAQANDATARIAGQAQQFTEGAFGRLGQANIGIAQQKRQNRAEFNQAKADLIAAGDQNIFNAISNVGTAGVTALSEMGTIDPAAKAAAKAQIATGRRLNAQTPNRGGQPYIQEGRQMMQQARQTARNNAAGGGSMMYNPWMNWVNSQIGYPGYQGSQMGSFLDNPHEPWMNSGGSVWQRPWRRSNYPR